MASGYGLYGGQGQCYSFWQEYMKCHSTAESEGQCKLQYEDYFECLHHNKEFERQEQIKKQLLANNGLKETSTPELVDKKKRTGILSLDIAPSKSQ